MHALITGITGFVGSHLANYLARQGWYVSGFATGPKPAGLGDFPVRSVDITDGPGVARAIAVLNPEVIFHLAGLSHVGASWQRPGDYMRVNFGGTRHLIEGAAFRRIVFASSAEVYGPVAAAEQPLREDHPVEPRSPYAMTKACAELLVQSAGGIVVRSFNAIGRGQSRDFALPSFAWQLARIHLGRQEPRLRVGDLSPCRDFLTIEDAVAGYALVAEKGQPGEVYNLASGQAVAIGEALARLQLISGVEAEVMVDPELVRKIDIPLLLGDITRISALGWSPRRTLDDALEELWLEALAAASAEGPKRA